MHELEQVVYTRGHHQTTPVPPLMMTSDDPKDPRGPFFTHDPEPSSSASPGTSPWPPKRQLKPHLIYGFQEPQDPFRREYLGKPLGYDISQFEEFRQRLGHIKKQAAGGGYEPMTRLQALEQVVEDLVQVTIELVDVCEKQESQILQARTRKIIIP